MKLSDVCETNPRSQAISDDTLVSFVAMPDVSEDGKINTSVVRPYGEVKKGYTVFQEGDILFAKITPCFPRRIRPAMKTTSRRTMRPLRYFSPLEQRNAIKNDFPKTSASN